MSEMEHHIGKVQVVIPVGYESLEDVCKRIAFENDIKTLPSYFHDWREVVIYELSDSYVVVNDYVYKIISDEVSEDYEVFSMHNNKDGTYDFETIYYNGACSLSEAIAECFCQLE